MSPNKKSGQSHNAPRVPFSAQMLSNAPMMLGLVSFALITKPSRAYSQLTVICEPSGHRPKIDCSQFFPAFCDSIGDEAVPPGEDIQTDLGCLEDQSLGASCAYNFTA
ncbi:hypothetical protein B0H14DRAFT_3423230 [Mycena olivaceomarginata]|nr:hypothetical protein B0H14DRAFT_3423230 [Mycena olivaceomarginata]